MRRLLAVLFLLVPALASAQFGQGDGGIRFQNAGTAGLSSSGTAITSTVPIYLPNGAQNAPALSFASDTDIGLYRTSAEEIGMSLNGSLNFKFGNDGQFTIQRNNAQIYFGVSADAALAREAANTLALRNSTNAQTFNIYNSFTTAGSNYGRFSIVASATGTDLIGNGAGATASTGAFRSLQGSISKALTDAAATAFVRIAIPQTIATNYKGGSIIYEIYCDDDTNQASQSGRVTFTCHNIAGTEACGFGTPDGVTLGDGTASLGTPTFDASSASADTIDLRVNSDCTGITPNTHTIEYRLDMPTTATITPQ